MTDFFRVKIVAKRQVTLPQMLLTQLGLVEGDELEFTVADGTIQAVRPYRSVPLDYFPPNVLRMIDHRSKAAEKAVEKAVAGRSMSVLDEVTTS